MREVDIGMTADHPMVLTPDTVITMGSGDACPTSAGKRYENRKLSSPWAGTARPCVPSGTPSKPGAAN